jgi:hypothetical protein
VTAGLPLDLPFAKLGKWGWQPSGGPSESAGAKSRPGDLVRDHSKRLLADMAERWVPEIMSQAGGLDQVWIRAADGPFWSARASLPTTSQPLGQTAPQLCDLERMREARMEKTKLSGGDNLGLAR